MPRLRWFFSRLSANSNSTLHRRGVGKHQHEWARLALALSLALIFALIAAPAAQAQQESGAILGTVVDSSGATVKGATVKVTDVDRGTSLTTKTNDDGAYDFPRVPVGNYEITVTASGFQSDHHEKFELILNQTARVDFQMKVGQTSVTVEVTGNAPILDTDTSLLGSLIDSRTAATLPLSTGNTNQLTLVASPGVITPNLFGFQAGQNTFGTGRPYVNGAREQENNFLLDGMDNNQPDNNDVAYVPAPEAVQEFNLITGNAPADFGNYLGGVVNVIIKSGTNDFHGGLYEYLRRGGLNANSWSNNLNGLPRPGLRYDRFGGTFGGPIVKDKLFFFADYAESLFSQPATVSNFTTITNAQRGGDFSAICQTGFTGGLCNDKDSHGNRVDQLFDPSSSANPATRTPFLNNQVPVGRFNSAAKAIINSKFYNFDGLTNNVSHFNDNSYQGDLKIDFVPTNKDHVTGRWSQQYVSFPNSNSILLLANTDRTFPLKNFLVDETHTFSDSLLNDARVGFQYFPVTEGFANPTNQNLGKLFGIANVPVTFLPNITFNGVINSIGTNDLVQSFHDTTLQFGDNLIWTRGRHEFHFGFQAFHYIINDLYPGNAGLAGEFDFSGQFTGNAPTGGGNGSPIADFALGLPTIVQQGNGGGGNKYLRNTLYGAFAQDNWRITNHLTLNLGLRYELTTARLTNNGQDVNFNLVTGVPKIGFGYNTYNGIDNWQPRLGFAYEPQWGGPITRNTVIRGAYSISSFMEANGINNLPYQNPPFVEAHTANFTGLAAPNSTLDQGFSNFPAAACTVQTLMALSPACLANNTLHLTNPNLQPAVDQQWNLSIEKQLGRFTAVKVGYVGNKIDHMSDIFIFNQLFLNPNGTTQPGPFAQPLINCCGAGNSPTIRFNDSSGIQRYNALQVSVEQRPWHDLTYRANYTWSKCLNNSLGYFGPFGDEETLPGSVSQTGFSFFYQNAYNPLADYGRCISDVASLFNGYLIYELPFGKGKMFGSGVSDVLNQIIGGWSLSSDFTLHTGFAIDVFGPDNSGTNSTSPRPNCVSGVSQSGSGNLVTINGVTGIQFWNPAAVSAAAAGTFGNCPAGAFRGPGLATADLSLAKRFILGERTNLQVMAQFINLTNTPILAAPSSSCGPACNGVPGTGGSGTFGLVTSSNPGRQIQFGMKLNF